MVGTFGKTDERRVLEIPKARKRPTLTCAIAPGIVAIIKLLRIT